MGKFPTLFYFKEPQPQMVKLAFDLVIVKHFFEFLGVTVKTCGKESMWWLHIKRG